MLKHRFRASLMAILMMASLFGQGTWVLAGTTGSINGTLTDANKNPVGGAKITATSPSQTASVTTDASGHYSFLSLAPDTYALSAEKQGLEPVSISGINVFADGQQTVNLTSQAALRTIGRVNARSQSDLVQAGRTTDVYTVTPSTQQAASALGGGGSLNQAYSALASVPGVYIPQGQSGIYQSVYLRGGNYTEIGYEFDGVPIQRSFDQYPSTALSALGQQNLQVYAGSGPLDAQSSGLSGFINQVIKTGTSPGFVNVSGSLGSPTFYHQGEFEAGGATKNGRFSYYVATAGYNQEFRLFDNFNGASLNPTFGTPYNVIAQNCTGLTATIGCYSNGAGLLGLPAGPAGFANGPFQFGFNSGIADRETVTNFHIGFPHKDGTKDDIQLLYDNSYLQTTYQVSLNDWGANKANVANGTAVYNGVTYPDCATVAAGAACAALGALPPAYANSSIYTGRVGVPLTTANANQTANYFFPYSNQTNNPTGLIAPAQRDTYDNRSAIEKVQFTKSLGSNAFARIYGYSFYSDWLQNGANSNSTALAGGVSGDYELLAHTRGAALTVSDQINPQNLLSLNAGYDYASTVRWNNSSYGNNGQTIAYAVSSANPADGTCYAVAGGVGTPSYCGTTSSRVALNGFGTPGVSPKAGSPSIAAIGGATCGGAPCEYLLVNNGLSGGYNTVAPAFTSLAFEDRIKPTNKLLLDLGVHYDDFRFNNEDTSVPGGPQPNSATPLQREFWTNVFNLSNCQNPVTSLLVTKTTPLGTACQAGTLPVAFSSVSAPVNDYHAFEPRFSATYTVDPLTVLRASYSKVAQAPSSAYQQYNSAAGQPYLLAQFYPIGFRQPSHNVGPEFSYNTDFSFEHSFKGTDAALSLTPFYRSTAGEIFNVLLDPKTNFISGINVGKSYLEGVEFAIHKGDFGRNGFAGQLSYTYTYGRTHYDSLPNGQTVIGPVNAGIQQYNGFTSFCAKNPKDPRCIQSTANPTGQVAAPCYTAAGAPAAACVAGDIANPYWNAPVQNLFDPNGFYSPFNQTISGTAGANNTGVNSSYVIPHVATLLLQYKHGPLTVTPTFQLSAGGKYGSPTANYGIDPSTCGGNLGAAGVAGDNRYPNGLPAGATSGNEYLAQSCGGAVFTPNRYTGQFDNFGQYTEPATFTGNVALGYQIAKNVSLRATLVNVFDQCFGGSKVAWNNEGPKIGCWYSANSYAGNFYNPGNTFQSANQQYPYAPVFGNVFQSAYGGATNPFQAYFSLNVNL